jgi:hypothetical protein
LNLASCDPFFAATKQMDDLQPKMQRQMTILENSSHSHSEGFLAGVALAEAGAGGLAVQATDALGLSTMRANGTIRPKLRLDIGEGGFLGHELRGGQNGVGHGKISYGRNTTSCGLVCQV